MSPVAALVWLAEIQHHVSGAAIYINHYRSGTLPEDVDIVDALAHELGAIGRAADRVGAVLS